MKPRQGKRDRRIVIDLLGVQGFDEGDVVYKLGRVRQQFAECRAGLSVLGKFEERRRGGKERSQRGGAKAKAAEKMTPPEL